jgi:hypothetical protein
MLTVIVTGRNDDYGKDFRKRLFRTALHNSALLEQEGIDFEYILAEWNPLPDRPPLAEEFVERVPNARAIVIPPQIHRLYTLNPLMPFHEMAAKNAALRRAHGDVIIATNADILFSEGLVARIAAVGWAPDILYRAHRIDVDPDLSWNEAKDSANHLSSGEGSLSPPYYLGAGGDFCLAARSLWHSLGGFNERIRFSTRAKDWQFFLSAATQGIGIAFIGDVYHLDHEDGFRNTAPGERNAAAAHFGRWWDIEFGLPATNSPDWGFGNAREHPHRNDPRIMVIESNDYSVHEVQDRLDREMMNWLTSPPGTPDTNTAVLLHSICAAHRKRRRLICRIRHAALAVTLSGLDAVAARFGVEISCDWIWPEITGYTMRPFTSAPGVARDSDWIVEDVDYGLRVYENGSGYPVDILPRLTQVNEPEFNPVLTRRLLYAYLRLQSEGTTNIAIYGAGGHTQQLLRWGVPDNLELAGIVSTEEIPQLLEAGGEKQPAGTILLSSASYESDMLQTCRDLGIVNVIALYSDWPRDLWSVGVAV